MQQRLLQPTDRGRRMVQVLSLSICLGSFAFSYNTVCLTQLAELFRLKNKLNKQQFIYELSVATSCFNLGTFLSPLFYRKYVAYFGELTGLLLLDIIGICAILAQMAELQFYILASARFCLGCVMGISSAIIPVFVTSIAPPSLIGTLGTYNQLLQTVSVLAAYATGYILSPNAADQARWRVYLGLPAVALVLRIVSLQIYKFETLQRHIRNNEMAQVQRFCLMVYGNDFPATVDSVVQSKSFKKISQKSQSSFRRRFIIAMVLIVSNQVSGTNAILYYAKQLFNKITDGDVGLSQILILIVSVLQITFSFLSGRVVGRMGTRAMILRGQIVIAICLGGIFVSDKLLSQVLGSTVANYGIVGLIFVHMAVMNLTLGPFCVIYCTEIVEDITWMIVVLKGFTLVIALTSEYMIQYMGLGFMFLIFFALTLVAHLFLRPRLINTQGLSSTQIYKAFDKTNNPVHQSLIETVEGQAS